LCRGEELIYSGVRLRYLLCLLRSPNFLASPDIGIDWLGRHEDSFFACYQVLHLHCQICVQGYAMQPVFLVPVEYVLVLQQVRILADVLTAWKRVTLLDMLECEEALMSLTHVVCPEVY
jgi:midasin (ATPase involved in ribosome maturation)